MAYTLITVTYGGEVNYSCGYATLYMCKQARSLALTGMTIEQNAVADIEYEQRGQSGGSSLSPTYFPDRGESMDFIRGCWVVRGVHDIKVAECIIEPEGE